MSRYIFPGTTDNAEDYRKKLYEMSQAAIKKPNTFFEKTRMLTDESVRAAKAARPAPHATGSGRSFPKYDVSTEEAYEAARKQLKTEKKQASKDYWNSVAYRTVLSLQQDKENPQKQAMLEEANKKVSENKEKKNAYKEDLADLGTDRNQFEIFEAEKLLENNSIYGRISELSRNKLEMNSKTRFGNQQTAATAANRYYETQQSLKEDGYDPDMLLEVYERQANQNAQEMLAKETAKLSKKNPVIATLGSFALNMAPSTDIMTEILSHKLEEVVTGKPSPVDTNSPSHSALNMVDTIRDTTSQELTNNIENKWLAGALNTLYKGFTGVGDTVVNSWLPAPAGLAIRVTNAGTSVSKNVLEKGGTTDQALASGLVASAVEVALQAAGLGDIQALKVTNRAGVFNHAKDFLKQFVTEGTEEGLTELANAVADGIINGNLSDYNIAVERYMQNGMNEADARKQANGDFAKKIGLSFAAGGLSGGIAGGVDRTVDHSNTSAAGRKINQSPNASGTVKTLIDTALQNKYSSNSYQAALNMYGQKTGTLKTNPSSFAVGSLANSVQADARQNSKKELVNSYLANLMENETNRAARDKNANVIFDDQQGGRSNLFHRSETAKGEAGSAFYENGTGRRIANRQSARQPFASAAQQAGARGVLSPVGIQPGNAAGSQPNRPTLNAPAKSSDVRLIADNRIAEMKEIVKDSDGQAALKTADNQTIRMDEAGFSSPEVKLVYEKALQMPAKTLSKQFVRSYNANKEDGGTAGFTLFNDAFRIFYKRGLRGDNYDATMRGSGYISNGSISLRSASQAFFAGVDAAKLKEAAKEPGGNRAEYKALQHDIEAPGKTDGAFYSAHLGTKKTGTVSDGAAKYRIAHDANHVPAAALDFTPTKIELKKAAAHTTQSHEGKRNRKAPSAGSDHSDIQLYRNLQYVKDISALKKQIEILKQQVKLTKGHKLSEKALAQFAARMLNKYHSDYDVTMLKGEITDLFEYIANTKNIDWDNIVYQSSKMARNLLSQSTTLNQELWNESKSFRQWLKATPISLSEAQKQEVADYYGSYDSFRKSLFGSVNMTDKGIQLDELWSDIANRRDFGYHFDGETNEAEQPVKLKEFLEMVQPTYQNTYEMDMNTAALGVGLEIYDAYFDIPEVHAFAGKKKQELINLKGQYRHHMGDWKKEYRTKYAEKLRQEKMDMRSKAKVSKSEALLRQKVHYQELRSNAREPRSKSL